MNANQIRDYFINELTAEKLVESLPSVRYRYAAILSGLKVGESFELLDLSPSDFLQRKTSFLENTELDMNLLNDLFILINS